MSDGPADLNLATTFTAPSLEAWRSVVERDLKGADFDRRLLRKTLDGISIPPLYTAADLPGGAGSPGAPPFTRGARVDAGWLLQVDHGPCSEADQVAEDLAQGAGAVRIVLSDDLDLEALLGAATPQVFLAPGSNLAVAPQVLGERPGSFGLDPLGAVARGSLPSGGLEEALALLGRLSQQTRPDQAAAEVATHAYHDAGAGEAQDLGCALATGIAYLRAMHASGLTTTEAAHRITFSVSLGCEQLEAIAKLRALRRCWTRVLEASGAEPVGARIHARTAWRELTVRDPWVNLLRATVTAFSAAVGGAERISPAPYDLLLGAPSPLARRLVRNTHHILAGESHLDRVADPAGGSYLLERLTEEMAIAAWAELQAIESAGGIASCLTSGRMAERIDAVAEKRARDVARRKRPLTGVSDFPLLDEAPPPNPMDAPSAPDGALPRRRLASPFERLRARADAASQPPTVFVAALGSLAEHSGRSTWLANLLAAGGLAVDLSEAGYPGPAAAVEAFRASGHVVAAIAGSDATYAEHAAATATALREAGARRVLLAGRPGERESELRAAGVDGFVYLGVDVVAVLEETWEALA